MKKITVKIRGHFRGLLCNEETFELEVPENITEQEIKELARVKASLEDVVSISISGVDL